MKLLRVAYNNTYRIMHCVPRNLSVHPPQVNHILSGVVGLWFLQRSASSSNFFI